MKKYYAEQNPVGAIKLNDTEFYRSIIDEIKITNDGITVIVTLRYPFPVGAIFHVVNQCTDYFINKRIRVSGLVYEIRKVDGIISPEDLLYLKKGAIIFRTGKYDTCNDQYCGVCPGELVRNPYLCVTPTETIWVTEYYPIQVKINSNLKWKIE